MKIFLSTSCTLAAAIALSASAAPANAAPVLHIASDAPAAHVIRVHNRSYRHRHHRRHGHRHRHDHVVDAPFAHVETGDRVDVEAPFTYVHVGRHGRRIVAPFVDLWLPR